METPDPPSDTLFCLKKGVNLTPHNIPRILRATKTSQTSDRNWRLQFPLQHLFALEKGNTPTTGPMGLVDLPTFTIEMN